MPAVNRSADQGRSYVVAARVGQAALWRPGSEDSVARSPVAVSSIGISERLIHAVDDWRCFFDEIDGDLTDPEVADEFVSQGFKIAHRLRSEIKGSTVHLEHPISGAIVEIIRSGPR